MRAEVHLHTNGPHSILLFAETDSEKQLLKIFDANYLITSSIIREDFAYQPGRLIKGVQLDLVENKQEQS